MSKQSEKKSLLVVPPVASIKDLQNVTDTHNHVIISIKYRKHE